MKTLGLLISIAFGLMFVSHAEAQKNRIGATVGMNLGKFVLDSGDLETRTGLALGGILDFVIDPTWAVRVAPVFVQKGAKQMVLDDEEFGTAEFTFKTNYFELPVLLKYGAYAGLVRPYFVIGPTFAFNVSSSREVQTLELEEETDIEGVIRLFDVGAAIGGGMSFPVYDHLVFVEGRYAFGFVNIQHDRQFSQFVRALNLGDQIKTRNVQIFVGVSLLL